ASTIKGLFPEASRQRSSSSPTARSQSKASREPMRFLSANDFRYPGESTALMIACGLLLLLIMATTAFTVGVILAVIAISVVIFKMQESGILSRCVTVTPADNTELYT